MVRVRKVVLAAFVAASTAWLASGAEEAMTNADIVRLTQAGIGESVVVDVIGSSQTDFDTTVDGLVALAEAGVGDAVIAAMVAAGRSPTAQPPSARVPAARVDDAVVESAGGAGPTAAPGSTFREALGSGGEGPEMVVVPAGRFRMGCLSNDEDCYREAKLVHDVAIAQPFALSVYEVTFEDYDRFTHPNKVDDEGWGRGRRPVVKVSWDDAQAYVAWLSAQTGAEYRLPSEAEWEYAARAGTTTRYHWGDDFGVNRANCVPCGSQWSHLGDQQTAPVGSFAPNAFGLYDMHGNVGEWVQDRWNVNYAGAPSDGGAWLAGVGNLRIHRGGSFFDFSIDLRAHTRGTAVPAVRVKHIGFRVARALAP